jgi:hypothetical protein
MNRDTGFLGRVGSGWLAAIVLTIAAAVVGGMSSGAPVTGEEAGYRLAAESLSHDGDLLLRTEDEGRIRLQGWGGNVLPRMRLIDGQVLKFREPWFYPALLAPFIRSFAGGPVKRRLGLWWRLSSAPSWLSTSR